jgi:hypothetical protein
MFKPYVMELLAEGNETDAEQIMVEINDDHLTTSYQWEVGVTASVAENPCNQCLRRSTPSKCLDICQSFNN